MAGTASDYEDESTRWRRLGELTPEEALLESHASAESVEAVIGRLNSAGREIRIDLLNELAKELGIDDARAVLLAVLGRRASRVTSLWLEKDQDGHVLRDSEAVALCVNLASNSQLEFVTLRRQILFGSPRGCELLGNALARNEALSTLLLPYTNMGPEAVKRLMNGLDKNQALRWLDLGINPLLDEGVCSVAAMLRSNRGLTKLQLMGTCCGVTGAQYMADAMKDNTNLLELTFGMNPIEKAGMSMLMEPFIHDGDASSPSNRTLRVLDLAQIDPNDFSVESLVQAIRTNKTLSSLKLTFVHLETRQWVDRIIPALEVNDTLKSLHAEGCRGLTVDGAFDAFMHLVRSSNSGLENIYIAGTDLDRKSNVLNQELRTRRRVTNDNEMTTRWKKLGQLEMADALRESNASSSSIHGVLTLINAGDEAVNSELLGKMVDRLGVDDGKSVLLAMLGRGKSPIKSIFLEKHRDQDKLNEQEALALCVNLASNPNVKEVSVRGQEVFGTYQGCELVGNALTTNKALQTLVLPSTGMGPEAVQRLMNGLDKNQTLSWLDLGINPLLDEGVCSVAAMLRNNRGLTKLQLMATCCGVTSAQHLADALTRNNTLLLFTFGLNDITKAGMSALMEAFVYDGDATCPRNVTVSELQLEQMDPEHFSVESFVRVIRTSKTLSSLNIRYCHLESQHWKDAIIPALEHNETLKVLDVRGCQGINEDVLGAVLNLVQFSNTGLEHIYVAGTGISKHEGVINEELRKNKEYRGRLRHQAWVPPNSGRIILCGYEYAGKTSIYRTKQNGRASQSATRKLKWKKFLQRHPLFRQLLEGRAAHLELQDRTRGFDILTVCEEVDIKGADGRDEILISIWDFAGQKEFYILHDYLFPNGGNSCFLYVCSARCPPDPSRPGNRAIKTSEQMKNEFRFWLRFIASNSRLVQEGPSEGHRQRPDVTFVLTNRDTLNRNELNVAKQMARRIVAECKEEFESVISFSEDVDIIDAHSFEDVENVFAKVKRRLAGILQQSMEYAVCEEVRRALRAWTAANPRHPLLSIKEFDLMCGTEVRRALSPDRYRAAQLSSRAGRETVLLYLNDMGEIIFSPECHFIVVNPRWFGVGLLGHLINGLGESRALEQPAHGKGSRGILGCCKDLEEEDPSWLEHQNGFVVRDEIDNLVRKLLKGVQFPDKFSDHDVVHLMIHLEMCFEVNPTISRSQLFIPALFNDTSDVEAGEGRRQLSWNLIEFPDGDRIHYLGRRLECENSSLTFLTPGFFPRLHVLLRNYLHAQKWDQRFEVARNLIRFAHNGMEVQIEYSGNFDYFVDILFKSSASNETTLKFLEEHIVREIRKFCASPQGCQGVRLAEAAIRRVCLGGSPKFPQPFLCIHRKPHAVRISTLKEGISSESGNAYKHVWDESIEGESDFNFALDLVEGEGSYRRFVAASQVVQADGSHAGSGTVYSNRSDLSSSQIQLPKRFFPTIEDVGFVTRLESRMNPAKAISIKLHLMCDGLDDGVNGPHKMEGQPGRKMKLNEDSEGLDLPILKYTVRLFWIGAKVTAGVFNVGADIQEIDSWVQNLFNTEAIPMDVGMLQRMVGHNANDASTNKVSENEILELLRKYMEMDPETQWLSGFLKLTDSKRFYADFQLTKVKFTDDESHVRWLCQPHFESGFREGRVRSVPH